MTINHVSLSGNLTRDAELRHVSGGLPILSLGLAFNERRRNPDTEEWEEVPSFIDCTLFGNRAEGLAPYLAKGTKVSVDGHLHWRQWETENGEKRSKLEVIVHELEFMTLRKESEFEE